MILNEAAVESCVQPHENMNIIHAFNTGYVKYPSVESARRVVIK
jgi:hypothetical protein